MKFIKPLIISLISGIILFFGQQIIREKYYNGKIDNYERNFPFEYIEEISFYTPLENLKETLGVHDTELESYIKVKNGNEIKVRELEWEFKDLDFTGIITDNKNTISAFEIFLLDSKIKFNRKFDKPLAEITIAEILNNSKIQTKLNRDREFCSLEMRYLNNYGNLVILESYSIKYNNFITKQNFPKSIKIYSINKIFKNFSRVYEN